MKAVSGIYKISTPNGSNYVGSSGDIRQRWAEHRSMLRRGVHHSERLQKAYTRHGDDLSYEIVEECPSDAFNRLEQQYIERLGAKLNTMQFVANVWSNPEIVAKIKATRADPAWRKKRSEATLASVHRACRAVVCSDGRQFVKMADAARAFNVRTSAILCLAKAQNVGRLRVAFRFADEDWRPVSKPAPSPLIGRKHSAIAIERMRVAKRGSRPSKSAHTAAQCPVVALCLSTGAVLHRFESIKAAAATVHPERSKTAQAQISKACSGIKKRAYGYEWRKAS